MCFLADHRMYLKWDLLERGSGRTNWRTTTQDPLSARAAFIRALANTVWRGMRPARKKGTQVLPSAHGHREWLQRDCAESQVPINKLILFKGGFIHEEGLRSSGG